MFLGIDPTLLKSSLILPLQNEVNGLEMYKMEQAARIQSLMEDNSQLKRTIANGGLTTPPPTLYPASLQVRRSEQSQNEDSEVQYRELWLQ